jgi:hypothetical protein
VDSIVFKDAFVPATLQSGPIIASFAFQKPVALLAAFLHFQMCGLSSLLEDHDIALI